MSNELDDVARSLFNGMIPGIWKRLAPDTLKSLANWMLHFQRRFEQYRFWVSTASGSVPLRVTVVSMWCMRLLMYGLSDGLGSTGGGA